MPTLQSSLACLENLVGLSQANCPCSETGRPEDYSESLSGLYMDDYEHGLAEVFSTSVIGCGDGSVWDVLKKARYEGTNDFITYLFKAIGQNLNTYVDGFSGSFGEVNPRTQNTYDRSCTKDITGFTFTPNVYNGAFIKLKKIWLGISNSAEYDIEVRALNNDDDGEVVAQITIDHPGAGKLFGIEFDEEDRIQPLSEAGRPISYSVTYNRNGGVPLNYSYHCGCGRSKWPKWIQNSYMKSNGLCVNEVEDIQIGQSCCNRPYTGGLILDWELICDPSEWLCSQDASFWQSTQWGRIASKACQLIGTTKLIAAILDTGRINAYTMLSADALQEKRISLSKLTDELINYLSLNMPEHVNHCWECKPERGFSKKSIIL